MFAFTCTRTATIDRRSALQETSTPTQAISNWFNHSKDFGCRASTQAAWRTRTSWCRRAGHARGSSGYWQATCTGMRALWALRWRAATGGWSPPPESISSPLSEVSATVSGCDNLQSMSQCLLLPKAWGRLFHGAALNYWACRAHDSAVTPSRQVLWPVVFSSCPSSVMASLT